MTEQQFDKTVTDTLEHIKNLLIVKGVEYRREKNVFHNFEEGAKRTGLIREKVLDGMLLKHEISIADMTNDLEKGILPKVNTVNEKFDDNIIYLLLKKASIVDRIDNKSNINQKTVSFSKIIDEPNKST